MSSKVPESEKYSDHDLSTEGIAAAALAAPWRPHRGHPHFRIASNCL
jgi:hypothetical protein